MRDNAPVPDYHSHMASDPLARFEHLSAPPVDGSVPCTDDITVLAFDRDRPSFWTGESAATVNWSEDDLIETESD